MLKNPRRFLAAVGMAFLLLSAVAVIAPAPAEAQCLSETECAQFRDQLRGLHEQGKALKRQLRQLRDQLRALPPDSPDREALRRQARETRRELRQLRHGEIRPLRRQFRQGCRGC